MQLPFQQRIAQIQESNVKIPTLSSIRHRRQTGSDVVLNSESDLDS